MPFATNSLPVPDSPMIRTVVLKGATLLAKVKRESMTLLVATILSNPSPVLIS